MQYLVNKLAWYYALNGINILLLIGRVLKRMDFQPRLGVVTRSLALAGPDLIHFCLVCGMVFVGYAMMAHLIFGNTIQVSRMQQMPPVSVSVCECGFMVHHRMALPLVDRWRHDCAMLHLQRVTNEVCCPGVRLSLYAVSVTLRILYTRQTLLSSPATSKLCCCLWLLTTEDVLPGCVPSHPDCFFGKPTGFKWC